MTRAQMNWKIVRSIIPIIGLWIIANSAKNLKEDYEPTEPLLKISASDLAWRFQVNEGANLVGKTIEIFGEITLIDSTNIVIDKESGEPRLSHRLDHSTGMYKGRQVFTKKNNKSNN